MLKDDRIQIFEERAEKLNDNNKNKVFLKRKREELFSNAEGNLLEVAVGRGSNFQFYSSKVKVTAVDFSPTLLSMAENSVIKNKLQADFIESDVETLEFKTNSFDTIVSSLTLCSYDNPIKVLNNFNEWCKPNGKILLLEHGFSSNKLFGWFINSILNILGGWHLNNRGCHLNSNIMKIIEKSDLETNKIKTCLLDTHYLIWAKPNLNS